MDIKNSELVVKWLKEGYIKIEKVETKLPSPFATNLVLQWYSDLLKMEDRINFLKRMHKEIMQEIDERDK